MSSPFGARYVGDMDRMFDTYAELVPLMMDFYRDLHPKQRDDSDFVYRQAIRAKAFDALRGLLPAASLSNVGIYGSGQAYEALLLRLRSMALPEANRYADLMLTELRKVIPSFLRRVDLADRGVAWSNYLSDNRRAMEAITERILGEDGHGAESATDSESSVTLVDFDPEGEIKVVAAMLYPYSHESELQVEARVREMTVAERIGVMKAYVGDRANRRHKPGRALERTFYHFDVLGDYGAFRDLQRHRMMTVEWQALTPLHGYVMPEAIEAAGATQSFEDTMQRSRELYEDLVGPFPAQAAYAVSLAYRIRYSMRLNAIGDAPPRTAIQPTGPSLLSDRRPADARATRRGRRAPRSQR
ncbi:MAG: FAD-dependent thymidylate synthase [Microthrixaceae bacterium]